VAALLCRSTQIYKTLTRLLKEIVMRSKLCFFALLTLLSLTASSWGSILYVSGDQTGTWSADTVIVTGEVRVPPNQSLNILPGVEVLFSVYCKLIVDSAAILRAIGTAVDSIRFDVLPPDTAWHGIRFQSASVSSHLEYCVLTHGKATDGGDDNNGGAIYLQSSAPTISHNTIRENWAGEPFSSDRGKGGAIYCWHSSPALIANIIEGNETSYYGGGGGIYCGNNSNPVISGNTIKDNTAMIGRGGGIYLDNSNPTISGNVIHQNEADYNDGGGIYCCNGSNPLVAVNIIQANIAMSGGGIYCDNSSPIINRNTIMENYADYTGGGICCNNNSNPDITENCVYENMGAGDSGGGGGIYCSSSNPYISGNSISLNSSYYCGGGIFCVLSSQSNINCNAIYGNSASYDGGGIFCSGSNLRISGNVISENLTVEGTGAGICCWYSNARLGNNTLCGNRAFLGSGGIYAGGMNPVLTNCVLWENTPQQIYGSLEVTYSNIQGGYAGTGNINLWPAFVDTAQGDYRLQWGSPCIDSGDPNPIYNDPDGTSADMGAWYYNQSMPVRVLLTPFNQPIQIPASGGSFQYAIQATNIETSTLPVSVWCDVILPNGSAYGPVLEPVTIFLGSSQTLSRVRTQAVPAAAPAGMYHYNAYAVAAGDTSTDSFSFVKQGVIDGHPESAWSNYGDSFDGWIIGSDVATIPDAYFLYQNFPNPFNPTTSIYFALPKASHVQLSVFDLQGRLVTDLINGTRQAGFHEITFDASGLSSGMYFYKIQAGDFSAVNKMALVK